MKTFDISKLTRKERIQLTQREGLTLFKHFSLLDEMFKNISKNGDSAVAQYTQKFDHYSPCYEKYSDLEKMEFPKVEKEFEIAIEIAVSNVKKYHEAQKIQYPKIETSVGITCWREAKPIERIGLYVPGGTAPLLSSLIMMYVPAIVAGCKEIVLCTPADSQNDLNPYLLWVAKYLNVKSIRPIGGAQAIFSMALGTETSLPVNKIFGPGNSYVTAAKKYCSSFVSIDMPAGPSEVLVISDPTGLPEYIAIDLLSQAEHGHDSKVVHVSNSEEQIRQVYAKVNEWAEKIPRKKIAQKALENSFSLKVNSLDEAVCFSNQFAPEHLILASENWKKMVTSIQNAGSVFCGNYTPEALGDYASGTNHVLPTMGFAKSISGLSLEAFTKNISFQHASKTGLNHIGKHIGIMAEKEGLLAHKWAVSLRKK